MRIPRTASFGLRWPVAIFAALLAAAPVTADVLRLDPSSSHVSFLLGSTFHDVHGTFRLEEGEILFDAAEGSASGRIVVSAASGESGNKSRDKKMHEDVLESATFPWIVFTPERMSGSFDPGSGGAVSLDGTIEIHGRREKITIEADVRVSGGKLHGTARMSIPYVAWGMKDPSAFIFRAEKTVEITLELSGAVRPDAAIASATE